MVLPKYDCNKSKFSTFAIICCTNEIKRVIRANNTQKRKGELISISEEITNEGLTLQDMLFQDEDILEEVVKQDIIQNSIPMLGPETFEYFINLKTQKQIALENNISQTTVCRKIHKNLEVIRTSIES